MKVAICFGKIMSSSQIFGSEVMEFATHVMGAHVSAALSFHGECEKGLGGGWLSVFTININTGVFTEFRLSSSNVNGNQHAFIQSFNETHDILQLPVSDDEAGRLLSTCRACVQAKKRYNYRDVLLYNVPFRSPEDRSIFEAPTLHDAQAVILMLRECLDKANPLLDAVLSLNSRTTMPSTLFTSVEPYLQRFVIQVNGDRQNPC